MEALFTEYYILNPRYKDTFINQLVNYKEIIFRFNEEKRIRFAGQRALAALDKYEETKDVNQLFEGYRLYLAASLYMEGICLKDCINIKNDLYREYLEGILTQKIKPDLATTRERIQVLMGRAFLLPGKPEAESIIKTGVSLIIKQAISATAPIEEFYSDLTSNEQEAYRIIISHLDNGEGNISISQLLQESTLSRPVFKNVLLKLENSGAAEITNQGTKGTLIKFIDKTYLSLFDNQ